MVFDTAISRERFESASNQPTDLLPSSDEFTRLALWMVGSVAGLRTEQHEAQTRHFRSLGRRVGWSVSNRRRLAARQSADQLVLLSDAMLGVSRGALRSVFGLPPCGVTESRRLVREKDVEGAGVWYFPLRGAAASAIALEFDRSDQVSRVVFLSEAA